jgi:hypothetical protein
MSEIYLIFFILVTFLGIVVCLKRPEAALLAVIFLNLVWPNYIVYKAGAMPGITPPRGILLLILVALFVTLSCHKIYRLKISAIFHEFRTIFVVLLMFSAVQLLSSVFYSTHFLVAIFKIINDFLMGPLLMILVLFLLDDQVKQKKLFSVLIVAFIVINIAGLAEWFNHGPLFGGYLITETEYTTLIEKTRGSEYRLMSVFANSLVFSQVLVFSIPLYIYAFLNSKRLMKLILLINFGLTIFLVFNTGSRAALALVLAFPLFYLYSRVYFRSPTKIIKYALICFPILVFLVGSTYAFNNLDEFVQLSTIGSQENTAISTLGRVHQLEIGIPALLEHPLLGYGVGGGVQLMYPRTSIDNLYLTILLDTGLTGLFLFFLFNYLVLKYSLEKKCIGKREIYIYISIVLILLFFLILSIDTMMTLYYILVAMVLHATRKSKTVKGLNA